MAITPSKPDRIDVTSRGKAYVYLSPVISAGGDTLTLSGIKEIWSLSVGNRPASTYSYTSTGPGGSVVLTLTVTASTTGVAVPGAATTLYVEGH